MKTGLFERILENIFFFQFIPSLTSSRKRQIRTPFSEIYFHHLLSGQQKGCADSVLTGSFPGPPSGQIPVESCEHPPPYASGLGYLVIREVFRLTPRMIVHRGPIDHAIEWRVLAAFCCILGSNCQKSQTYGQKLGRHFMACSRQRFLSFSLRSDPSKIGRHQNQSRAAVLAHIFSDPRLPAGPPNAVTRSRRKYHSAVTRADYSVFKVPANVSRHIKSRTQGQKGVLQVPGHRPLGRLPWLF